MDRRDPAARRDAVRPIRPKVRILGKYYAPFSGGIEQATKDTAEALAIDYRVEVFAFAHEKNSGSESIDGVEVRRFATQLVIASQPISIGYALAVLRGEYDVLIVQAPNVLAGLAYWLRRTVWGHRATLFVVHQMDIHGRLLLRAPARWLYDRMIDDADRVVVSSLKNATISQDIRRKCALEAIPLGIDTDDYGLARVHREQARKKRRALAGEAPVVGFVGRHARYKGLHVLIHALAALDGVHGMIGGEGEETPELRALAKRLGVADRVHFLGPLNHAEKLGLLTAIDVFAFPSTETTEAFGITQLEAMWMGAPLVASDLPSGVSDISVDGYTALTVAPNDAAALAAALDRMIVDRALARRLADNARAHVGEKFTTERMAAAYRALVDGRLER